MYVHVYRYIPPSPQTENGHAKSRVHQECAEVYLQTWVARVRELIQPFRSAVLGIPHLLP